MLSKNIKTKIIHLSLSVLFLLVGCSEFLYQEPDTQISIDEQFSTELGLLQTVNGIYVQLESLTNGNVFVYADLMGGNITFAPNNSSELEVPVRFENSFAYEDLEDDSDFYYFYKDAYDVINQTNMILEHLYDAPDVSASKRQQIKAEILALRAYMHSLVSLLYAQNINYTTDGSHKGIVYNTRVLVAGEDYPSRETKKNTYDLIMADLKDALALFTDDAVFDYGPDHSYFNAVNTKALMARIALDHGDWETAFTAADSVIRNASQIFVPKDDYISAWKSTEPMPEVLFELSTNVDTAGARTGSVADDFFYYYFTIDTANNKSYLTYQNQALVASEGLRNCFAQNDIRKQLYTAISIPALVDGLKTDSSFYFTEKFQGDPNTTIMRLSELYLIRAEARFMKDGMLSDDAISDLNMTRERAGLTPLSNLIPEEFIDELYLERRRELAFEGQLFFDHMRLQRDVKRSSDTYGAPQTLNYPNNKFVLPLPKSTLDVNEFLEQNEGY